MKEAVLSYKLKVLSKEKAKRKNGNPRSVLALLRVVSVAP